MYDQVEGQKWLSDQDAKTMYSKEDAKYGDVPITIPRKGTYYFAACNPHTGFLGIGKKDATLLEFTLDGTGFEVHSTLLTKTITWTETYTTTRTVAEPFETIITVTKTKYENVVQKLSG